MADKKSVNLLPEYLRSNKNAKFLTSTLDQFIQTPELERIDGYVGSKLTPTYNPVTDIYIKETQQLRKNYQLEPALVFRDSIANITDVIGYDDLINEISRQGGKSDNLDKIFRPKFYSYDPLIDWDKLINYNEYYWLPNGPDPIVLVNNTPEVIESIIGQQSYTMENGYDLTNGMKLVFTQDYISGSISIFSETEYIVEGVGTSITLIKFDDLEVNESFAQSYNETFDSTLFDDYPFDSDKKLPIIPEYISINRSSKDLNSWSRYNRWFHKEVIRITAEINNQTPVFSLSSKAKRPIIEFKPNIQLYNFGTVGVENVDLIDTDTVDAMSIVQGSYGYYIDGVLIEHGQRVIFNADQNDLVRGNIYEVTYTNDSSPTVVLTLVNEPQDKNCTSVNLGLLNAGKSYYYDALTRKWVESQQHTSLNQAPLFDLFTSDQISFTDESLINDFRGTKIFSYDIGTGTPDSVLGFPLKYQNSIGVGSYLFKNHFMTDIINITENNVSTTITTGVGYLRINNLDNSSSFLNVWRITEEQKIPVIELRTIDEPTSIVTVSSIDGPYDEDIEITVFVNGIQTPVDISIGSKITVSFDNDLKINDLVQLKIVTDKVPNENGFYEVPLGLTNNPLNDNISDMTLSELSDHLSSMVSKAPGFVGEFPGISNLRDLSNYTTYGNRLIVNSNPIAFTKLFLAKNEHNVIDAIREAGEQYNQFKMNFLKQLVFIDNQISPSDALDIVLKIVNKNKDNKSSHYLSDMLPYGADRVVKEYTVGSIVNSIYPIGINFNTNELSFKSLLVYLNNDLLIVEKDYTIDSADGTVRILSNLTKGDLVKIVIYNDTRGSFVPSTPSKLGLFPKFIPEIYVDDSYVSGPVTMIKGHDGSLIKAYGDYRDNIILEFEKRVYNNIKVSYNNNIFDVLSTIPSAFRSEEFSISDANNILRKDFNTWAGMYNVDVATNSIFDDGNPFTWNFKGALDSIFGNPVSGSWRSIFKYFYDTDRPHTHPWEMLGLVDRPDWWEETYGPAPYTNANTLLWNDLEDGYIRGENKFKSKFSRPGLSSIIPVDSFGNLRSPETFLVGENGYSQKKAGWMFGDCGPAETAWRNSSYWPFAINALCALLRPCDYTAYMYDLSRTKINQSGQIVYSDDLYLNPKKLITDEGNIAGFGVFVIERGKRHNLNYIDTFVRDISYVDFNLFYKLGGFASKDKIQITIDSVDPVSLGQGALLPPEDYSLILNVSNPIKTVSASGIIVQKFNGNFVIKGYDRDNPYFNVLKPIKGASSGAVTVGGKSAPFSEWSSNVTNGASGLTASELASATTNTTRYYKQGQIVRYNNKFYRVKVGHTASSTFDPSLFQQLPSLPSVGGASAALPATYETSVTQIPYGTEFSTIQEVYDLIVGYGAYLESQGFIFDEYNSDLFEVIDWKFTAKEFLYWTTQNWSDGNLITLSPFANRLKFQYDNSIVDDISGLKYEYSLQKADGKPFPIENFNLTRIDGVCTIETLDTQEGLFFAVLNAVQKEHAMVFNNNTIFNDTMYDIESGYRQRRIKISGFRTANWNGDLYSPGFVFDDVQVVNWAPYGIYLPGKVVRYNGAYYESLSRVNGDSTFDFTKWVKLSEKPIPDLLPNFDYKIKQFEDFYSLDIDNFDQGQQQLAQHLVGYTPRVYLNNIFTNPTTQYKFYQGFIRDKGTRNALDKIVKASRFARKGDVQLNEEWAFRIGHFGGFESFKEVEFTLEEGSNLENPYIVKFSNSVPNNANPLVNYVLTDNLLIKPSNFSPNTAFKTFKDETFEENNLKLLTAGYARLDDVTVTAYSKNSLLDIANNGLMKERDTVWLGFLEDGGWDIYRYSRQEAKIAGVFVSAPAEDITFVTDVHHGLAIGDIVSVVNFNDQVDGVYIVKSLPELNQFTVASELTTITNDDLLAYGALFKFEKARFNTFEDLTTVKNLINLRSGEKLWIDNDSNNRWAVYQKLKNYSDGVEANSGSTPFGQQVGHTVYTTQDSPILIVSAPTWEQASADSVGKIWVYEKFQDEINKIYEYILNSNFKTYCQPNTATSFGYALAYETEKGLLFATAPEASQVRYSNSGNVVYSTGTGVSRAFVSEGLVKISSKDAIIDDEVTQRVLLMPSSYPADYSRFGHSIYINQVDSTSSNILLVGAPGDGSINSSTGYVFAYSLSTTTSSTVVINEHVSGILLNSSVPITSKSRWGHKISGSKDGSFIAVSAPGYVSSEVNGFVEIFNKDLQPRQLPIISPFGAEAEFGDDVFVSESGKFLFVSSINTKLPGQPYGKVAVYTATNLTSTGTYVLRQIIDNPVNTFDLKFGKSISLSADESTLVISALGTNRSSFVEFDKDSKVGETYFDQSTTRFVSPIEDAGAVYVFNNLGDYFIPAEELNNANIVEGSRYGNSLAVTNNSVYVGAPWLSPATEEDDSTFFKFDKIDTTTNSWNLLREQPDLVDVETIRRSILINSLKEEIVEYLDIVDPLKGKIAGIAEQELKYKTAADPAVYSVGIANTVNDTETNWIDEHVGELWWDLSTAKYLWYEQGEDVFRKNTWGQLFPGASIDVYEWVKSDLLPSEWAAQADTNEGLTNGISGQPKYPDNSILSVKQVWNTVTNSFENVYYFWVKNKVIVPSSKNRRISSYDVARIIADPVANGIKFVEILSQDSVAFANIQPMLVGNYINANIATDDYKNKIPRHTEWLLLEEGNSSSVPTTLLNKKLFDSLLGHDSLGNSVPASNLSSRNRYGIGIRPQQTLFKDRLEALRNLVEFANSVLISNKITGNYSFENLNKQEEIPDILSREYDFVVEDLETLSNVVTSEFAEAVIECFAENGRIVGTNILNPGFGYEVPPEVFVKSQTGSGAKILTEINSLGQVISLEIENPGSNYTEESPVATVRPHTVIVQVNSDYGNRWTKHVFDYQNKTWLRIKTQSYNTPLFWDYTDWVKDTYDGFKDYRYVFDNVYQLSSIEEIDVGDYVKINNGGDGRYIILEKLADNEVGDFSVGYNIVYSERGTIQILDTIWNYQESNYSYDAGTLEETLYDQIPDLELFYILTALKEDVFIKDLKVNWNLFFFKAVRYALTEQKILDWAFKTSFVTIKNRLGYLDQRPVYKIDNEKYFEEYLKEIKPYRTKIRSYTSLYDTSDIGSVSITDFDLPPYYNTSTDRIELVQLGDDLLAQHPWKDWYNNYKFYVKSVEIANPGAGYTQQPEVVFTSVPGDTGSGATGEAYIRNGQVYRIIVTNGGSNYLTAPRITLVGGGNVTSTATMSVIMDNDCVRKNTIGIKFDRVGIENEIRNSKVTESFICTGEDDKINLSWLAEPNKENIVPLLDGKLILATDYTIEYYTERYLNYTKDYCRFVFLNIVPVKGQIFKITYNKNINLYTAVDRIQNYYRPTDSMPGNELPLLMSGAEYGSNVVQGLTFGYSTPWGQGFYDNNSAWSDLTDYYASSLVKKDLPYGTSTIALSTTTGVYPGQRIVISNTSTKYLRDDTVVLAVNTATREITISDYTYNVKKVWADSTSTTGTVVFYTIEKFAGDIRVGDRADITGIDNGTTIYGFDGSWYVTGVGNDRFTAVGTGTHSQAQLSTTTIKISTGATVHIPSVVSPLLINSAYEILNFQDSIRSEFVVNGYIDFDTYIPLEKVSGFDIRSSSVGGAGYLMDIDSVAPGTEHYITSNSTSTLVISAYNLTPSTYTIRVYGYPEIEFWKDNFNVGGVDTELKAGSWNGAGNFVGALGVDPTDLSVIGGGLLDPNHGFAPEEHVKGQTFDTVGISVYTQDNQSSPLVINGVIPVTKNKVTVHKLPHPIDDTVGILVEYNGKILDRLETPPNPEDVGPYFSTNPATPLGPTGAPIASAAGDDTFTGPYPLGMNWNMFGTIFTEVYVGTNGYITFGGGDSEWTPLNINQLENPSIMIMYCDLWQALGSSGQPLDTGETPGLFFNSGTVGNFQFWRLRFQGTHYNRRDDFPTVPAYQYEVTLYSDGTNQYVEMIYENTWRSTNFNGDLGFVTGIASENGAENVEVPWTSILSNTSHVFYSTSEGGAWKYAGQGSFDPNKEPYNFTARNQYFITGDTIYIAPQDSTGRAGYTLMDMGGDYLLDSKMITTYNDQTEAIIESLVSINDVRSVYVTMDGIEVPPTTSTSVFGYQLLPAGEENNRAAVMVYNLPGGVRTLQAWFFEINYPEFGGVWTEYFNISSPTSSLSISNPLPSVEPISGQILVEWEETGTSGRKRLSPPDVTYYQIKDNNLTFVIGPNDSYAIDDFKVHVNGMTALRPGFDYTLAGNTINIVSGLLKTNDVIAIEILLDYDYIVLGGNLIFATPITQGNIKVTTFNDYNGMVLRSERFPGNAVKRFTLGLPAISASYIWAYVNGAPVIPGYDFELLDDMRTVQFSEWIVITPADDILITSINAPLDKNTVLGYKIFKDIFDRTTYLRLADFYSTRLSKELEIGDTEIYVDDSTKLVPPNPVKNIPGVIYIDGERIEFFERRSNTLSNIRRSTLGTAPASFSEIGSKIIDQSSQQRVPYNDVVKRQIYVTSSTTGTFVINTVTNSWNTYTFELSANDYAINTGTVWYSTGTGIVLNTDADLADQLYVSFGGRPLRKKPISIHDTSKAFDSTSSSLVTLPPEFTVVYNTNTSKFEMNLNIADFAVGVRIDVEQRTGVFWQTNESLLVANTPQAEFLRQKTSSLPDIYYYGGDPVLTDRDDFELTDENNNPIQGY